MGWGSERIEGKEKLDNVRGIKRRRGQVTGHGRFTQKLGLGEDQSWSTGIKGLGLQLQR